MSTGRQLLEELKRDEELRRALAEELLPEALRHRELRRAMLIAISREMATKDDVEGLKEDIEDLRREVREDVEKLRRATKEDVEVLKKEMATKEDVDKLRIYIDARIDSLNKRIDDLGQRVSDLYGILKISLVAIVVTLASTILTPLILKLFLGL
jgi:polyhydroxyalkanoate synthesis regulator phasin